MPKKGKKGKKGGKKNGKSKSPEQEADLKTMSAVNSNIWQTRLEVVERSRTEHREHALKLALENEALHSQVLQTEKDTVDVVGYLKEQDEQKDRQITKLKADIEELKRQHLKEKEKLISEFQSQVIELDNQLTQRTHEVDIIRSELKLVKEFRRKRAQIQRELDEIKETLSQTSQEHKETLAKMEKQFFDEKMKLQQEANRKIVELADKAHTETISNLDETTKSVFKENVRLTQALGYHIEEAEDLRKQVTKLEVENRQLRSDQELNEVLLQRKVSQSQNNKQTIKQLQEKISTLEQALSHAIREFNSEQGALVVKVNDETESARTEIAKLRRILELKTKEMNKVKKLAKNILDQRTEVEHFFLEALDQVKKEVLAHRMQYRHDAEAAYQQCLLDACMGKAEFPKIRTFKKGDMSTNSVFDDLQAATSGQTLISGHVDISELTWEQKEKVLRYLFARMNKVTPALQSKQLAANSDRLQQPQPNQLAWQTASPSGDQDPVGSSAFITQSSVDNGRLPSIEAMS